MTDADRIAERVREVMSRVDRKIASGDTMYTSEPHYFAVAESALRAVLLATETVGMDAPRRILDFGSGFGRVMRALRAAFPAAELVACDINAPGIEHCAEAFGARPVLATADLGALPPVRDVDAIWCGSVLTHLDAPDWPRLLGYFAAALAPNGVAVVTTHGRLVAWKMENGTDYGLDAGTRAAILASYRAGGFGFRDYPGHQRYGHSLSSPAWAVAQAVGVPDFRLIGYVEAGWDDHQDVLSVAKDAGARIQRA